MGALLRVEIAQRFATPSGRWPWDTLLVNLAGAFLLGYAVTRLQERLPISAYRRPFIGTGLCGALTTFSTMQLELLRMLDSGHTILAVAYAAVSILGGLAAVSIATALVRRSELA